MPSLKIDLHVHTSYSKDSLASPGSVVKKAIELGLDAIAVTDHDTIKGALEAEKLARGKDLLVIPGQEIHTQDGEVIILGIRESLPSYRPALETLNLAKQKGGFVIIPHPFDFMRKGLGRNIYECLDYIDAIEVFNARTIFNRANNKALEFADQQGFPKVTGSDSHFLEEMDSAFMLVKSPKQTEAIFNTIRSGNIELIKRKQAKSISIKRGLMKIRTYF
jgi:predicted metal-dependent phosphoesterase TrpH